MRCEVGKCMEMGAVLEEKSAVTVVKSGVVAARWVVKLPGVVRGLQMGFHNQL